MPNLILKANVADIGFNIQHKVLQMPVAYGMHELIITPLSTYTISAQDFTSGVLPREISKIEYENLGEKIIAKIFLKATIDLKNHLNISVPISGKSFLKKDTFNVIETTSIDTNVLVENTSINPKSIDGNKITYKISNDLSKKMFLFTKKFTVIGDYYFSSIPTYNIKSNNTRYAVVSRIERNAHNKIISKSFDFFYTSPKEVVRSLDTEISFDARANPPAAKLSKLVATKKEEYKIYSINRGRDIGSEGGIKRISIKGVPRTPYKIIVSDSNNNTYNYKTGIFEAGGGMIEGVIPSMRAKRNYGEAEICIRIPKTISANVITTNFLNDNEIDHALITSPGAADSVTSGAYKAIDNVTSSRAILSVTIDATGSFTGPAVTLVGGASSTSILIGKGNSEVLTFNTNGSYQFSFVVQKATHDKFIEIERQPLFVMPTGDTDNYVAWDSGTNKDRALTSAGVVIPSDWDFVDAALVGGLDVSIRAKVTGLGRINAATSSHDSVLITGYISVNNVGTVSSELKLKLLNFLTQVTPS
tara:strand:+ start:108 stop:1703 length:1596 start_codon:yes stop_codon:yes gene_type:complete